ncbi:hypothetical protein G6F68_015973 [Rhizopus microsporus]|nr:hypothetical protein G6F68_015973 [Rhizopus microsporus]
MTSHPSSQDEISQWTRLRDQLLSKLTHTDVLLTALLTQASTGRTTQARTGSPASTDRTDSRARPPPELSTASTADRTARQRHQDQVALGRSTRSKDHSTQAGTAVAHTRPPDPARATSPGLGGPSDDGRKQL